MTEKDKCATYKEKSKTDTEVVPHPYALDPKRETTIPIQSYWCEWPDGRISLISTQTDLKVLVDRYRDFLNIPTSIRKLLDQDTAEIFLGVERARDALLAKENYWIETFECKINASFIQLTPQVSPNQIVMKCNEDGTCTFLSNFADFKEADSWITKMVPFTSLCGSIGPLDEKRRAELPEWVQKLFQETKTICHRHTYPPFNFARQNSIIGRIIGSGQFKCFAITPEKEQDILVTRMKSLPNNRIRLIKCKFSKHQEFIIMGDQHHYDLVFYQTHMSRISNITHNSFDIELSDLPFNQHERFFDIKHFEQPFGTSQAPSPQSSNPLWLSLSIGMSALVVAIVGLSIWLK
jgi:hypothetical protein